MGIEYLRVISRGRANLGVICRSLILTYHLATALTLIIIKKDVKMLFQLYEGIEGGLLYNNYSLLLYVVTSG